MMMTNNKCWQQTVTDDNKPWLMTTNTFRFSGTSLCIWLRPRNKMSPCPPLLWLVSRYNRRQVLGAGSREEAWPNAVQHPAVWVLLGPWPVRWRHGGLQQTQVCAAGCRWVRLPLHGGAPHRGQWPPHSFVFWGGRSRGTRGQWGVPPLSLFLVVVVTIDGCFASLVLLLLWLLFHSFFSVCLSLYISVHSFLSLACFLLLHVFVMTKKLLQ